MNWLGGLGIFGDLMHFCGFSEYMLYVLQIEMNETIFCRVKFLFVPCCYWRYKYNATPFVSNEPRKSSQNELFIMSILHPISTPPSSTPFP